MELLQLNKFGDLHNGKSIIFCKTEYLEAAFKAISKIKNRVILISGNSDGEINKTLTTKMPDNILWWYCQNNVTYNERLKSIPIGLENTIINKQKKHGAAWDFAKEKIQLLTQLVKTPSVHQPKRFLYANFNIQTNITHRNPISELCKQQSFITWQEPTLNYTEFVNDVLDHEAVLCPAGNGIDTHRLYEILYIGRIPITFKIGNYPVYTDLYDKLPVVVLDSVNDLKDKEKIQELIVLAKEKTNELNLIDFNFWRNQILNDADNIVLMKPGFFKTLLSGSLK